MTMAVIELKSTVHSTHQLMLVQISSNAQYQHLFNQRIIFCVLDVLGKGSILENQSDNGMILPVRGGVVVVGKPQNDSAS